ncbi:MAG: S9 family peptidase [Bacteroidetes bacterium]|nr:S9 family peptidase [Bacteroidota bacterium]
MRLSRSGFIAFAGISVASMGQDAAMYQKPPRIMEELLLAAPTPNVGIGHQGSWMLITERSSYPSLAELAEPEVRVGGLRMNPSNFSPSRSSGVIRLRLQHLGTRKEAAIAGLPSPLRAISIQWSPDESRFAFIHLTAKRADLYMVDIASATARKINRAPLNVLPAASYAWVGNDKLLYKTVPAKAGTMPVRNTVPKSPVIQENMGRQGASRTYQDLIKTAYDEELFAWLTRAQMMLGDGRMEQPLGKPAIFASLSVSPDQAFVLAATIEKPFSYLIPASGFPQKITAIRISDGKSWTLAETPSEEGAPIGFDDVPDFPRSYAWRSDAAATVTYVQPLDKGRGRSQANYRDALIAIDLRGDRTPQEMFRTRMRFNGIVWGDEQHAIVYEGMFANRRQRMNHFNPTSKHLDSLFERSSNDAYSDLGTPMTVRNKMGREILALRQTNQILLRSQGASPEGDMPFVQSLDLLTGTRKILWRCQAPWYEQAIDLVDVATATILTSREGADQPPNYFLRTLEQKDAPAIAITQFPHPYPAMKGVVKNKVSYPRADGISLTGDLYLPAGYDAVKQGPLPVLLWAYPREYRSAADAAQVRGSRYAFTRIGWGSPIYWVTQGYAVLDNAEMPIVGEGDTEPNDRFIPQLYLNAHAAIRHLAAIGVGDSNRVGVGGHSYGAFMTANLLAHTTLFKAGIARSGAYNRTLTPFGFQAEERTYWQAPKVYFDMSPFSFADKVKTPILLIHGEMDNNTGTFPIQSERYYQALKGHGATVRYIQLPYESHGYQSRENLLHMLWEQHQWLETHVKGTK